MPKLNPNQGQLPIGPSATLEPGECRDCKAPIYWATMAGTGSKMPLDRGADTRVVLMPEGFKVTKAYKSHFASCPFSENFRRRKT